MSSAGGPTRRLQWFPALSPDERWLAYMSDESGVREIYVTSFPEASVKKRVSFAGGEGYSWDLSPDGRRFLVLENPDSGKTLAELVVVQSFLDELRRRVPGP